LCVSVTVCPTIIPPRDERSALSVRDDGLLHLCSGSINQRNSLVRKQVIAGRIDVLQIQIKASCALISPADENSPPPVRSQLRKEAETSLVPARIADEMSFRQPLCMRSCRDGEDSKGNKNILSCHINLSF
jgi:hypothetical protein